jgi:hypothetical protein
MIIVDTLQKYYVKYCILFKVILVKQDASDFSSTNTYYAEFDVHESVHRDISMNSTNEVQIYRLIYYS